jgi:hypothetical protein
MIKKEFRQLLRRLAGNERGAPLSRWAETAHDTPSPAGYTLGNDFFRVQPKKNDELKLAFGRGFQPLPRFKPPYEKAIKMSML